MDQTSRHSAGRYYSPRGLAQRLCALALPHVSPAADGGGEDRPFRVLDASAGDGAFLEATILALDEARPTGVSRVEVVGFEASTAEARKASDNLAAALRHGKARRCPCSISVTACNALEARRAASVRGGFDLAVGNPPFVESPVMLRRPDLFDRAALRETFESARGNFDAFVPFVELSIRALRPGGVACLILPNKFLAARYAAHIRNLCLRDSTLTALIDLSEPGIFDAGVYPVAAVFRRRGPGDAFPQGAVALRRWAGATDGGGELRPLGGGQAGWIDLGPDAPWSWMLSPLAPTLERIIGQTRPLGEQADICGAATVAEAYEWLEAFDDTAIDADPWRPGSALRPLICSGAIRPFRTTWGVRPSRYLGRTALRPALRLSSAAISARRKGQFACEKLILSGLALRPTAFWDRRGAAAGAKSTVLVTRADMGLGALAAWLNSRLAADLYRALYGGLALSGGYLRFGPPQLRAFPAPRFLPSILRQLEDLAKSSTDKAAANASDSGLEALQKRIDGRIREFFGLDNMSDMTYT